MNRASTIYRRFLVDERGASAVEYGILVATIVMLMAVGLNTYPPAIAGIFSTVTTATNSAIPN